MIGKGQVEAKMRETIRVEKVFEGTDVTASSNTHRTCIQNSFFFFFFYGFSRFDETVKPVWANQLARLPCLVVYVKFQFV